MDPQFFRRYADIIKEKEVELPFTLDEKAPPGKEAWIRANKKRFIDQYGKDKGLSILYATAWKQHNQNENTDVDYTSATEPMSELHIGLGSGSGSGSGSGRSYGMNEKYMGFNKLEKQIDKNPKVDNPAAVAAAIGRKSTGKQV